MKNNILNIFSEWHEEFTTAIVETNSFCVAIFSLGKELIFANAAMKTLLKDDPAQSFINPTLDKLFEINTTKSSQIFTGFITIGDNFSINTSIFAHAFKKNEKLIIIGGVNALQLMEQNISMHQLNTEVLNLQRELIKEKHILKQYFGNF